MSLLASNESGQPLGSSSGTTRLLRTPTELPPTCTVGARGGDDVGGVACGDVGAGRAVGMGSMRVLSFMSEASPLGLSQTGADAAGCCGGGADGRGIDGSASNGRALPRATVAGRRDDDDCDCDDDL